MSPFFYLSFECAVVLFYLVIDVITPQLNILRCQVKTFLYVN